MDDKQTVAVFIVLLILLVFWWYKQNKSVKIIWAHRMNCRYCVDMLPEWKKLENQCMLSTTFKTIRCDVSNKNSPYIKYHTKPTVPSIYVIKGGKSYEYNGDRTAKKIKEFAECV